MNCRIVKLSSPNLNYLIVVGAALLYTCVYLYTYTADSLDKTVTQSVICNVRTAMLLHVYMYKSEEDREKQVPTDTVISKPACI